MADGCSQTFLALPIGRARCFQPSGCNSPPKALSGAARFGLNVHGMVRECPLHRHTVLNRQNSKQTHSRDMETTRYKSSAMSDINPHS
jgi:hypothetical protein